MERKTTLAIAKEIMGNNFIGPSELKSIESKMGIYIPEEIISSPPKIQFEVDMLEKHKDEYILILGIPFYKDKSPLTIVKMREHFGWDPEKSEPCFYNQDWYLNEEFANKISLENKWYLLRRRVEAEYRSQEPKQIKKNFCGNQSFPSAVLVCFVFFAFVFARAEKFWEYDFTWCNDKDGNGDIIYVGRYTDILGINKNGINIHRYLSLKSNYSISPLFILNKK